ncbi:MAG: S9 family peptidase [Steroidobacteraceae bacterium]
MLPRANRTRGIAIVCFVLIANVAAAQAVAPVTNPAVSRPEKYPVEAFGTRPFLEDPVLSPTGEHMAAKMNVEGKPVLAIINVLKREQGTKMVRVGDHEIRWFDWAGPDRLLISLLMKATLDGYDTFATRLISYELSSGKATYIGYTSQGVAGDEVIYTAKDGSHVLITLARSAYSYPSVYRADLATGELTIVVEAREPIWNWYADSIGSVRAGIGFEGERMRIFVREGNGSYFKHVASVRLEEFEGEIDTVKIPSIGDKSFVVTNEETGRFGLYEFDWKTWEIGKPIFEHPTVDIDDFTMSDDESAIEAVYYTDDRQRVQWFRPEMKALQKEIDAALVGRMNWILSSSRDRMRVIIWTGTTSDPGHFYYYDRPTEQMSRLATPYEALKGKQLSPVRTVSYKARDGLEIPAYLTLPPGREEKNLPLVLLPHGGPHVRDSLGFNYWVQFLANRGYAVLQPNFRGSSGYGRDFLAKGFGQWGRGMQDDLTDGVQWLIREGTVDPKRICIAGASYGGYAALMGAITTPELFRCAISWAGVTDVDAMMQHDKSQLLPMRYRRWRDRVRGEAKADLRGVSPVRLAGKVSIPILVMHGTDDENVPIRQAKELLKSMLKAGKTLEYIEFPEVGHDIENTEDRIRFLSAVEAFLAKHNPAD